MTSRTALLAAFCTACDIGWALEQPDSSLMTHYCSWHWLRTVMRTLDIPWFECYTEMGAYDAKTEKGTHLYGNRPWILKLARKCDRMQRTKLDSSDIAKVYEKNGRKKVDGGKGLKGTQSYIRLFGQTVADCMASHTPQPFVFDAKAVDKVPMPALDPWRDCHLDCVLDFLKASVA